MRRLQLVLALWLPLAATAADFPDLPPAVQVEQALRAYPLVRAAEAGVRVETANRDRLSAGPHEFALKLASQRRHERTPDLNTRDHEIGIERAIRLPGKSARDDALGAAGIAQAEFALGDALHESARLLLRTLVRVAARRRRRTRLGRTGRRLAHAARRHREESQRWRDGTT